MSDKVIAFTEPEMEGLNDLPLMQRWLYLVLRWYMDVRTGRVGDVRGISLQSLAEELHVAPVRGRHASECGSPSKKAIRSALDGLERAGMIKPCGNGEVLVFFLPRSRRVSARPKDEGHMRGTDEGLDQRMPQGRSSQGFTGYEGRDEGHTQTPDEGHTSRKGVNPPTVEAEAPALPSSVENLSTVLVMPLQPVTVATWIRLHERQRGCRAKVVAADPRIAAWIEAGATPEELAEAYAQAALDREMTKNPAPLNVGFLDIFVRRVLEGRRVSSGDGGSGAAGAWHQTWEGLNRKAAEIGIPVWDKTSSEGFGEYQRRVMRAWAEKAYA